MNHLDIDFNFLFDKLKQKYVKYENKSYTLSNTIRDVIDRSLPLSVGKHILNIQTLKFYLSELNIEICLRCGETRKGYLHLVKSLDANTESNINERQIKLIGELTVGDKYEVGQAAAVGPKSRAEAHEMTFNQIWNQNAGDIDLNELVKELSVLRNQLKSEATEPEHDSAIGAVASAEVAAKSGDGAKVLEHLAIAGKWVLDVAQKLAIPVAIAALKAALGL